MPPIGALRRGTPIAAPPVCPPAACRRPLLPLGPASCSSNWQNRFTSSAINTDFHIVHNLHLKQMPCCRLGRLPLPAPLHGGGPACSPKQSQPASPAALFVRPIAPTSAGSYLASRSGNSGIDCGNSLQQTRLAAGLAGTSRFSNPPGGFGSSAFCAKPHNSQRAFA